LKVKFKKTKREIFSGSIKKLIRERECYICGKKILKGNPYLYESREGIEFLVECRSSHIECNMNIY